jgi:hypothetical protein
MTSFSRKIGADGLGYEGGPGETEAVARKRHCRRTRGLNRTDTALSRGTAG